MKLIILGPQASGKGTQAEMLAKEFGLRHISPGELLRQEVASGSRLGLQMKAHMDKGELVPDELVEKMVMHAIEASENKFILDGFPRDEHQAKWLDEHYRIEHVVQLTVADKTAVERIGGRRECPKGHDYHLQYKPPKQEGLCDIDGLPLKRRADDTTAAIMKRLQIYHNQTEPIIAHYRDRLVVVNGEPSIKDVHLAILKALHRH